MEFEEQISCHLFFLKATEERTRRWKPHLNGKEMFFFLFLSFLSSWFLADVVALFGNPHPSLREKETRILPFEKHRERAQKVVRRLVVGKKKGKQKRDFFLRRDFQASPQKGSKIP